MENRLCIVAGVAKFEDFLVFVFCLFFVLFFLTQSFNGVIQGFVVYIIALVYTLLCTTKTTEPFAEKLQASDRGFVLNFDQGGIVHVCMPR